MKGVRLVPYRLPEVLKASEVLIVEGEKDADNLVDLGFTATTSPMGAKKWREEYSGAFSDKDVVLIPDNDQDGREHMVRVASTLDGTTKSLKWVDLPGLPSKGDVSDFIAGFKNKEDAAERLSIMIEGADPYHPPKQVTLEDIIVSDTEFKALDIAPKQKFLHPWLSEQTISMIYGWRGAGKTWIAMSILDAVSRGLSFGPWKGGDPVSCLFLDGEMPPGDIQERMKALALPEERKAPLYIYSDALANLHGIPRAHLGKENWREKMKAILIARKVKLWVIDNLASLAAGIDENKKADWDPINQWLLELRFAGISTLMLHHEGKTGSQRGTAAREDNIDISIRLKRPHDYTPEDGARFIAHFVKARVGTSDLNKIGDTEFKLIQNETGEHTWTYGNVRAENKRLVVEMLGQGIEQKTIAETLELSKGYVSKVRKQALEEGLITKKGDLSQDGFAFVYGP